MTVEELRSQFDTIRYFEQNGRRAPHKPLLVIYALGRCYHDDRRLLPFPEVERQLGELLTVFGTSHSSTPQYPFWHLRNDGLWVVPDGDQFERQKGGFPLMSELRDAQAGFSEPVYQLLRDHPLLGSELAHRLLYENFPPTLHDDILNAAGLHISPTSQPDRPLRDPEFRSRILDAYDYRCAVCDYDIRLDKKLVGLQAAHVKWHQAGGPDVEENGLALCVVHHKLFDRGAWRITDDYQLIASNHVDASTGLDEWLLRYHGSPIARPTRSEYRVNPAFVEWHNSEVFKGTDLAQPFQQE